MKRARKRLRVNQIGNLSICLFPLRSLSFEPLVCVLCMLGWRSRYRNEYVKLYVPKMEDPVEHTPDFFCSCGSRLPDLQIFKCSSWRFADLGSTTAKNIGSSFLLTRYLILSMVSNWLFSSTHPSVPVRVCIYIRNGLYILLHTLINENILALQFRLFIYSLSSCFHVFRWNWSVAKFRRPIN